MADKHIYIEYDSYYAIISYNSLLPDRFMKKVRNNYNVEDDFKQFKEICDRYGFECFLKGENIHILTTFEAWYLYRSEYGTSFILYHGNTMGRNPDGYHRQFQRNISCEEIVEYMDNHQKYKYIDCKNEVFLYDESNNCIGINPQLFKKNFRNIRKKEFKQKKRRYA